MPNDAERLDWFPCEPGPLLEALSGMPSPKKLVYLVVLLRIYDAGGACADSVAALAMRTGHNKRVVSDALNELFQEQRLYRGEGGIRNRKADAVIAKSMVLRERRQSAGAEGGKRSSEKRKTNQQQPPSGAGSKTKQGSTPLQLQDSLFSNENRAPEPEKVMAPSRSAAMQNPPMDAEADYYRRGREVLGSTAGGMLTRLLRAKGGNVALARAGLEQASTRGDAKAYVGAMIRNGGDDHGTNRSAGGVGGFAAVGHRIRSARADADAAAAGAGDAAVLLPRR